MNTIKILEHIEGLSYDELDREIALEESNALRIDKQLHEARAKRHTTGESADVEWYTKAVSASKLARFKIQLMQRRRKQLKSKQNKNNVITFERTFMEISKRLLSEDTYQMLIDQTREEIEYEVGQ